MAKLLSSTSQEIPLPLEQGMQSQTAIPYDGPAPYLITASTVKAERVEWLWKNRIPRGKIAIGDGDPGLGKSTVWLDLAARISTGGELPDGELLEAPGSVIVLSAEDGISDTIVPRLTAAGADLTRIHILGGIQEGPDRMKRPLCLPDDIEHLHEAICQTGAVYVVLDPLIAFLSTKIDSYKDQHIRQVLHPLKDVAEETNAAFVFCRHLSKAIGSNAIYRGGGSIGIIGAARVGLLFAPEPSNPDEDQTTERRIMAVAKSNVGMIPPALAYRVVSDPEYDCARIVWEGTTSHTANQLVAPPPSPIEAAGAIREAAEFLQVELLNGGRPAKEIEAAATEAGISKSTLRRARERLGIKPRKQGQPGNSGQWLWELLSDSTREDDHHSPKMTTPESVDTFSSSEHLRPGNAESSTDSQ